MSGFSLRIPLPGGKLKFKSKSRLRQREIDHKVPVVWVLGLYIIWDARNPSKTGRDAPMF